MVVLFGLGCLPVDICCFKLCFGLLFIDLLLRLDFRCIS